MLIRLRIEDHIDDMSIMTTLELGAFFKLLMICSRSPSGYIHDDDSIISRYLGMGVNCWIGMKPIVMRTWQITEDGYTHPTVQHSRKISNIKRNNRLSKKQKQSTPKSEPEKEQKKRGRVPMMSTRLPDDWELPEEWGIWAEEEGLTREEVLSQEKQFFTYWTSSNARSPEKKDWKATWKMWVLGYASKRKR